MVDAGAAVSPGAPWLAFGVAPSGVDVAGLKDGHLLIGGKPQPLLDVSGLDRAAVVQVGTAGGQLGVLYSDLGAQAPSFGAPFRLLRGDLAVLGAHQQRTAHNLPNMQHRRWRLTLTGRQHVPHALQVRTKAILFDAKIHVH